MKEPQTTKQPISETLIHLGQDLNDAAYEKFTSGELNQWDLTNFYQLVGAWSRFTARLLDEMDRLGIRA